MPRPTTPRRRSKDDELVSSGPRVRPQEQLLIDAIPELPAGRVLTNTAGRGQFVRAYSAAHPETPVVCWFLDVYQRDQSQQFEEHVESAAAGINWLCAADPPAEAFDLVAWSLSRRGDGELTREMLQLGHERLALGGRFAASIDHPEDQWLHTELKKLFPKVTRRPLADGVLYLATKAAALNKYKHYDAEFAFRDQGRLLKAVSRPGVFSHRHIDGGARALVNTMAIANGQSVLDLGCGSGVVGIAALARAEGVSVLAVDSNPRALESALRGVELNGLTGLTTSLDATGETIPAESFDLVLANPPYFSHYRIAELFLQSAHRALRRGGTVLAVTKTPNWFCEQMPLLFADVEPEPVKDYWIVRGRRGMRSG